MKRFREKYRLESTAVGKFRFDRSLRRRNFELDIHIARFRKVRGGLEVYVLGSLERRETRRHGFYRGDLGISSSRHSDLYADLAVIAAVYLVCIQKGSRHTVEERFFHENDTPKSTPYRAEKDIACS